LSSSPTPGDAAVPRPPEALATHIPHISPVIPSHGPRCPARGITSRRYAWIFSLCLITGNWVIPGHAAGTSEVARDGSSPILEAVTVDGDAINLQFSAPANRTGEAPLVLEFPPHIPVAGPSQAMVVASPSAKPLGAPPAGRASSWQLTVPRLVEGHDRLYSSFALGRTNAAGELLVVGTNRFVERWTNISRYLQAFPRTTSKKGLQVQMLDDALELGIKHASFNVNLTSLIDLAGQPTSFAWPVDGVALHFHRGPVESLDRQVRTLTDAGVVVTFILLTYASGQPALDRVMLHPGYEASAPNRLGAFNAETAEGARHLRGVLEFLADRYANPTNYGGRAANYILGNEVNSHWFWANMGRVSMETFAESYLRAARIAHAAIRRASSSARLYLSLEHHWSIRYPGGDAQQAFAGRPFLEYFNRRAREQGDFEWHLAFHPYPENLFEPRTWNDRSATTNENTPRITFKNLQMLERFLERADLHWAGAPRRVILSEQGFHTVDGPQGELWQAAAYAYAYYKVAQASGIDAFILHRHVDHGQEGGLRLGLWTRDPTAAFPAAPKARKRLHELFRVADTPAWEKAAAFALPVIGLERWEDLSPAPVRP
jgi:hypothetical protein